MSSNQRPSRVVVNTQRPKTVKRAAYRSQPRESVVALAVIGAAALATFAALLITSRPYDPMNSTIAPQETVPPAPISIASSPTPIPTGTPSLNERQKPVLEESPETLGEAPTPSDAEIKAEIEQVFASDAALSNLDVIAIVDSGRVTLSGSVESAELRQKAERAIRSIKGVTSINNQLVVTQATPQ